MNIDNCISVQERARWRIPGMTQLLSKRPDMFAPGVWPGYFSKASGVDVWDLDGNRYIDMSMGGIGANVLGYADPEVDDAVIRAIRNGSSSSLNCYEEVELAELLCDLHPWSEMARFARSGGEAMAVAVRIARAYTQRDTVAFCGYHGWHDWYLSANIIEKNALREHLLEGLDPRGVPKALAGTALPFHYNRIEELEVIVQNNPTPIAAVVMEPIRNEFPNPGFLEQIRRLTEEIGAVLIFDEISSGFRMNTGGAHLKLGVSPDIAVFSKALGNGYPIAAVIGKRDVMQSAQSTFISSTMWTERVGSAAALATIVKHRRVDAGSHLMQIGEQIQAGWKRLAEAHRLKIRIAGIPPMGHFSFAYPNGALMKTLFVQQMLDRGFLATTGFYSMYAHQTEHVEKYLNAANDVFQEISKAIREGDLDRRLKGKPATSGFKRLN